MEQTKILHTDYLDILFDQRNKSYGGYELRKHYDQRVRKALLFIAVGVPSFAGLSFMTAAHGGIERKPHTVVINPTVIDMKPIAKPELKVKHDVTPPPQQKQVKTKIFTDPIIDLTDKVPDDKLMTQNKELKDAHAGTTVSKGDTTDIAASMAPTKGTGTGKVTVTTTSAPLKWVSQMPEFVGDMQAYIGGHINYPATAQTMNIEGTVMIQFVVNEDGSVSDAKVMHSVGGGCDEEAARIVNGMPKWKPGKQNGTAVKVYFTLPIKFILQ